MSCRSGSVVSYGIKSGGVAPFGLYLEARIRYSAC